MQGFKLNQYALGIHTSSSELGLVLTNFAETTRCQTWDLGRDLSTHLHQHLADFIQPQSWYDLAFVAVAKGPGSFTGTRIGVVTARTLAQQLDIPLFTISTLAAVAWQSQRDRNRVLALQMPAQRGQLFTAIYQISVNPSGIKQLLPEGVMSPETWQQTLDSLTTSYELVEIPAGAKLGASVASLLDLADLDWQQGVRSHWSEALPFYGQHPVQT